MGTQLSSVDFDDLLASSPLTKMAALGLTESKDNHSLKTSDGDSTRDFIPFQPVSEQMKANPGFIDLTGKCCGQVFLDTPIRW